MDTFSVEKKSGGNSYFSGKSKIYQFILHLLVLFSFVLLGPGLLLLLSDHPSRVEFRLTLFVRLQHFRFQTIVFRLVLDRSEMFYSIDKFPNFTKMSKMLEIISKSNALQFFQVITRWKFDQTRDFCQNLTPDLRVWVFICKSECDKFQYFVIRIRFCYCYNDLNYTGDNKQIDWTKSEPGELLK